MFTVTSSSLKQYVIVITVNLSILCVGMDIAWSSPMLVKLKNPHEPPLSRPITEDEGGWIASIGYLVSFFTLPFVSYLLDLVGRKYCILIICWPKIISGLITIFATEVWMILVARVISGVSNTSALLTIMIYCTEIASSEIRGALSSLIPLLSSLGGLAILGIGPYISYLNLSILFTAIVFLSCIPLIFIPDTPYSLYSKGKIEEAEKVLIFLRESKAVAQEEMNQFSHRQPKQKFDKRELFTDKACLKGLIIAVVFGIGIQIVGHNCISFYLQTIFEITNTSVSPAFGSVIIGFVRVIGNVITSFVTDRFGRRPILISTLLGVATGMVSLGVFFRLRLHGVAISGFLNYMPVISVSIVSFCYCGGIGSQYFVVITELLDGPARSIGTSISLIVSTVSVFTITKYTMEIMTALGSDITFFLFGFACILLSLFIMFFVPETKRKTIAEIQSALRGDACRVGEKEESDIISRV